MEAAPSALVLERLWLTDFRSHVSVDLEFARGVTALVGPNGSGKTNIVEAIGWITTTKSFRGAPTDALIRRGADRAIARAQLRSDQRELLLEAELPRTGRARIQMNRQRVQRTRDLLGVMSLTVFAPDDLEMIKGSPGERRTYLDHVVVSEHPRNEAIRANVEKVLKQRNALLKGVHGRLDSDAAFTLDVWDQKLAEGADQLGSLRADAVSRLNPLVSAALRAVAGDDHNVRLDYTAPWCREAGGDGLLAALSEARKDDVRRGVTTVGPHRDEIEIVLNDMPARTHASQGEQRSLALALRLAGHELVRNTTGVAPLLVLDDVFSELDDGRSAALVAALPSGQTLLTSAVDLPVGAIADATIRLGGGPTG